MAEGVSFVAGAVGGGGFELVQEVLVADGDHDLGAEAAGGGQGGGGEGGFAGADQAVEELLGPGAPFEMAILGSRLGCGAEPRAGVGFGGWAAGLGAGVGGGVHDGEEVFVLVGGGEDFEVVQAAAGAAEEGALAVAEFFFGGFGAVLVDEVE